MKESFLTKKISNDIFFAFLLELLLLPHYILSLKCKERNKIGPLCSPLYIYLHNCPFGLGKLTEWIKENISIPGLSFWEYRH